MSRETTLNNMDVRPSAFVHFVLKTARFEEQKNFYLQFLNSWEVFGSDGVTFLTYDQEHHRVAIAQFDGIADLDRKAAGIEHVAFAFGSIGDLLANYLRLKNLGILPYWCINHGSTTSLYYRDRDGNQIETQTDNFDTHEELVGFFQTDAFRENPLGIQFDPDRLVQLYRDGVPEVELKRQGIAPRAPGTDYIFGS
ncbi:MULTISPECIES: VOC family protein [Sphingobium]|uniref:VOC family protein n=1 Tax=Sphingobium TaxID=165695 RepID=UPI001C3F999B|nr:VOC family protein [Sphingobium sp. 15-1]